MLRASFYKPPDMLEDVLNTLQATQRHHVLLSGAPGIGKSAMAAAVHASCMQVRSSLIRRCGTRLDGTFCCNFLLAVDDSMYLFMMILFSPMCAAEKALSRWSSACGVGKGNW
jgi:hypothetical protein